MTHVPPKDGLPPDIRDAIKRAMPQKNYVRGVSESGEEYRLVAIPVPGPGDRPASGDGVRLGLNVQVRRGYDAPPGYESTTHVPPKNGLPPDVRDAIKRAMPRENYVRGVTESGEEYRLVAIPVPGPGDRPASGDGVRLGLKEELGRTLGDLD